MKLFQVPQATMYQFSRFAAGSGSKILLFNQCCFYSPGGGIERDTGSSLLVQDV
jgi:hypothetical protein